MPSGASIQIHPDASCKATAESKGAPRNDQMTLLLPPPRIKALCCTPAVSQHWHNSSRGSTPANLPLYETRLRVTSISDCPSCGARGRQGAGTASRRRQADGHGSGKEYAQSFEIRRHHSGHGERRGEIAKMDAWASHAGWGTLNGEYHAVTTSLPLESNHCIATSEEMPCSVFSNREHDSMTRRARAPMRTP